jgi:uncharacterized Rmd1/YagE family protein
MVRRKRKFGGSYLMRCVAYCIAESLQLNAIFNYFKQKNYTVKLYRGVLYATHPKERSEIFFFKLGCFVSWGLTSRQERALLKELKAFAINAVDKIETDSFVYLYGEKTSLTTHAQFNVDVITLEDDDLQIKLAISYGIAQSIKLELYETSVQKTIKINASLPNDLATKGKIALSGKAISKRIGEIYLERSSVNLNSEYLDMPEYFWQFPRLENYYIMTEKFLDITRRVNSLNQRLDVLHGLLDVLNSQLQHRHSSLLESIIIALIFIEIILNIFRFHF